MTLAGGNRLGGLSPFPYATRFPTHGRLYHTHTTYYHLSLYTGTASLLEHFFWEQASPSSPLHTYFFSSPPSAPFFYTQASSLSLPPFLYLPSLSWFSRTVRNTSLPPPSPPSLFFRFPLFPSLIPQDSIQFLSLGVGVFGNWTWNRQGQGQGDRGTWTHFSFLERGQAVETWHFLP